MTTSFTSLADPATPDGQRIAHRHKVFLPVRMTSASGDSRVHLINVSLTGALAHQAAPPSRGTPVGIDVEGRTVAGRVVWVDGQRFGIAFAERLTDRTLRQLFAEPEPMRAAPGGSLRMPNPIA